MSIDEQHVRNMHHLLSAIKDGIEQQPITSMPVVVLACSGSTVGSTVTRKRYCDSEGAGGIGRAVGKSGKPIDTVSIISRIETQEVKSFMWVDDYPFVQFVVTIDCDSGQNAASVIPYDWKPEDPEVLELVHTDVANYAVYVTDIWVKEFMQGLEEGHD